MFEQIKAYYHNIAPGLTATDWEFIQEKFTIQYLKKGEFLSKNGDVCNNVSFINSGLVRMFYLSEGKEICNTFSCENQYISDYASFLTRQPGQRNIDALEDCEIVNLSFDDMQVLYKEIPKFETFGRKIAEGLFIMISIMTNHFLTMSPEERYRVLIKSQPFVIQRVPQYMIASYIGITPEHLSRLRKKMAGK